MAAISGHHLSDKFMALEKVRADTMGEKTEENAKYIKHAVAK